MIRASRGRLERDYVKTQPRARGLKIFRPRRARHSRSPHADRSVERRACADRKARKARSYRPRSPFSRTATSPAKSTILAVQACRERWTASRTIRTSIRADNTPDMRSVATKPTFLGWRSSVFHWKWQKFQTTALRFKSGGLGLSADGPMFQARGNTKVKELWQRQRGAGP